MNYAGFWRRFFAFFVDVGVMFVAGFAVGIPFAIVQIMFKTDTATARLVVSAFVGMFYYVYFIGSVGQTLGKRLLGIKVIRTSGGVVGYGNAFLREVIGRAMSGLLLSLGYFWMIWDGKKQTWHDKIAGTVVVRV